MEDLNKYVSIYKEQLEKGDILIAYNELVKFVMKLRTDFIKSLSDQYSFAGILHGYMDYTYFYYSNDFLVHGLWLFVKIHGLQKLKIRRYTKLVSNLVDCCFFLNSFWLKNPKNTFL